MWHVDIKDYLVSCRNNGYNEKHGQEPHCTKMGADKYKYLKCPRIYLPNLPKRLHWASVARGDNHVENLAETYSAKSTNSVNMCSRKKQKSSRIPDLPIKITSGFRGVSSD